MGKFLKIENGKQEWENSKLKMGMLAKFAPVLVLVLVIVLAEVSILNMIASSKGGGNTKTSAHI